MLHVFIVEFCSPIFYSRGSIFCRQNTVHSRNLEVCCWVLRGQLVKCCTPDSVSCSVLDFESRALAIFDTSCYKTSYSLTNCALRHLKIVFHVVAFSHTFVPCFEAPPEIKSSHKVSQPLHSTTSFFCKPLLASEDIQPSSWKTDVV